ncbi:peptidoglycan-binding domain-containing protein [Pseudomonas sp. MAG733B]|uniref:peptidoglycan-binding domain-containing protein n=1 Tax=Pseudomonas sp. MAG733B TaxID=3122079 RepID=UPI000FA1F01C
MKAPSYVIRTFFVLLAAAAPAAILLCYRDSSAMAGFDWPRLVAWITCLVAMLVLFILAGLKIRGRVLGVLVDERNRYSLSRLQISLWTVLVLATVYVAYLANIVRGPADDALDIDLDYNLIALMGFSLASFVAAPMALSRKAEKPGGEQDLATNGQQLLDAQNLSTLPSATGQVLVKNNPKDARLADLIRGEDVANAMVVDLPRLQMLLITAVIVFVYGVTVGHSFGTSTWLLDHLPKLNQTLLLLALISHSGYVVGKLIPTSATSTSVLPQQTARALTASQRAASLAGDLQARLNACAPGDPLYDWLRRSLALTQVTSAEASALIGQLDAPDFNLDAISRVEGRIDALQASLSSLPTGPAARQMLDAPSEETVRKVQQRLYNVGHNEVTVNGIADAPTEQAIRAELVKQGIARTDLHPRPYRYFEELAHLIK